MAASLVMVFAMICVVLVSVSGVFVYKSLVTDPNNEDWYDEKGAIKAGILNAIQVRAVEHDSNIGVEYANQHRMC